MVVAAMADSGAKAPHGGLAALALGALGVVYGDIGTSPLYTVKTTIELAGDGTPDAPLGILSLIVWTLLIITSIKYVAVVMRADNDGEGGILALMSLLGIKHGERAGIIAIGLLGAALLYGDGAITPAISVLSALEGLKGAGAGICALCVAVIGRRAARRVRHPAAGQRPDRQAVRPDHDGVVPHHRGARDYRHPAASGRDRGARSALWPRLSLRPWHDGISGARRGIPVRHRRGGALRRHGTFRTAADPLRLVWAGAADLAAQLCGPDRDRGRRRRAAAIRSSRCAPRCCKCRWWCLPRPPRSSPARRSSVAPFP